MTKIKEKKEKEEQVLASYESRIHHKFKREEKELTEGEEGDTIHSYHIKNIAESATMNRRLDPSVGEKNNKEVDDTFITDEEKEILEYVRENLIKIEDVKTFREQGRLIFLEGVQEKGVLITTVNQIKNLSGVVQKAAEGTPVVIKRQDEKHVLMSRLGQDITWDGLQILQILQKCSEGEVKALREIIRKIVVLLRG